MNKLILIVGCLALTLIVGFVLTWPKYQAWHILSLTIAAKETELQSQQEYFKNIKETSEELAKYSESLDKISSALPYNPSLPAMFNFLQVTASKTGLILEEITLGGMAEGEIRLSCQAAGNYLAMKSFLLALENSARMIEVENIAFISPEEKGESFSFAVRIKTHSY